VPRPPIRGLEVVFDRLGPGSSREREAEAEEAAEAEAVEEVPAEPSGCGILCFPGSRGRVRMRGGRHQSRGPADRGS